MFTYNIRIILYPEAEGVLSENIPQLGTKHETVRLSPEPHLQHYFDFFFLCISQSD